MKKLSLVLFVFCLCVTSALAQATDQKIVDCGGSVTIKATPAANYHFVKWTKGGEDFLGNTESSIQIDNIKAAATYVAHFAANETDFGDNVTITPATFDVGDVITLTANSDECHTFTQWSDGVTDLERTITYNGTVPFVAEYEVTTFTVTADVETEGQGSVSIDIIVL